ncbi:hypothetical protein [Agarilytica rhodophyticola]|uniref:hypothetical protein n=1 Tax=Agarilytica rhodophyticola TaxID=1737490 RepID=UPI000B345A50|nr:hypothetical protein [Agarilytica rhodophyticola]
MFRLLFRNKLIGVTKLESGDPSICCASGELVEAGTCEDLSRWMLEEGGVEEDGAFLLEMDNRFLVVLGEHTPIPFAQGSIICVPEEDEIFLDLQGIPGPEYAHFFPQHIASMASSEDGE